MHRVAFKKWLNALAVAAVAVALSHWYNSSLGERLYIFVSFGAIFSTLMNGLLPGVLTQLIGLAALWLQIGPTSDPVMESREIIVVAVTTALVAYCGKYWAQKVKIQESMKIYRELAESMPQIVWVLGPDGYIDYVNRRWSEFTGEKYGEWRHSRRPAAIHADDYPVLARHWRENIRTGSDFEYEARIRRKDGVYRWFLVRARDPFVHRGTSPLVRHEH